MINFQFRNWSLTFISPSGVKNLHIDHVSQIDIYFFDNGNQNCFKSSELEWNLFFFCLNSKIDFFFQKIGIFSIHLRSLALFQLSVGYILKAQVLQFQIFGFLQLIHFCE